MEERIVNLKWGMMAGFLALTACALRVNSQPTIDAVTATDAMQLAPISPLPDERVLRKIDDPATGHLWLVLRNPNHPAGPGRLVPAPRALACHEKGGASKQPSVSGEPIVIHAGDVVTVEEHTPVLEMRLQAMALQSSLKGGYFKARLKIGGRVARVMAVAPGHAVFGADGEVTP